MLNRSDPIDLSPVKGGAAQEIAEVAVPSLHSISDRFCQWVLQELKKLPPETLRPLRGDFLFVVDGAPLFVLLVDPPRVGSARVSWKSAQVPQFTTMGDPMDHSPQEQASLLLQEVARVKVYTDPNTLQRLLLGTIKARVAFLSGKVKIKGDLPAFLQLVAHLKRAGVRPLGSMAVVVESKHA